MTIRFRIQWDYDNKISDPWDYAIKIRIQWDYDNKISDLWDYVNKKILDPWDYVINTISDPWDYDDKISDPYDYDNKILDPVNAKCLPAARHIHFILISSQFCYKQKQNWRTTWLTGVGCSASLHALTTIITAPPAPTSSSSLVKIKDILHH